MLCEMAPSNGRCGLESCAEEEDSLIPVRRSAALTGGAMGSRRGRRRTAPYRLELAAIELCGKLRRIVPRLGVKGSQVQILSSRPAYSQVTGRFRGSGSGLCRARGWERRGANGEPSCSHLGDVPTAPGLSVARSGGPTEPYRAATFRCQPWGGGLTPPIRMYRPSRGIRAPWRFRRRLGAGSTSACSPCDRGPGAGWGRLVWRRPGSAGVGALLVLVHAGSSGGHAPWRSPVDGHSRVGGAVCGRWAR
jgi:hypothetical protein